MNLQIGGLKLKDKNKKGFLPVFDMINKPSCVLELLTYKSLKGFMISLNISPEETEYYGLNGNQFTKPITSFILKFAVITLKNDESLPIYKDIEKSSESKESYYEEAMLQQNIWKRSIIGGRPEICPPVANFSLFDNQNSKALCEFLQDKTIGDVKDIFNYLFNTINNTVFGIGVIVMPKIDNSITFGDFLNKKIKTEIKNDAYANVSAQIVRLFIDIGVIHFDLHSGNVLIFKSSDNNNNNNINNLNSLIIDFGRASNLSNENEDDYLDEEEKEELNEKKSEFLNRLLSMDTEARDEEKSKFILEVLDLIADTDFSKNQELFEFSDPERYQMDWYREYPRESFVPVKAFDILKKSITTEGIKISPVTIKTYENQGYIFSFKSDVRGPCKFFVKFPQNTQDVTPNTMGRIRGGKKYKKTKHGNKYKKTKKSNKTMKIKRKN